MSRIYNIAYGVRDISTDPKNKILQKVIKSRPMDEDEEVVWRAWLPSTILVNDLPILPSKVDETLKEHLKVGILRQFEVWATADKVTEFTLCGVLDGKYYRIARWRSDSDPVIAYNNLKEQLMCDLKMKMKTRQIAFQLFPGTFMFLSVVAVLGLAAITWFRPSALLEWLLILGCVIALSTTVFYRFFREWMQRKHLKEDRLKIAIDRDNAKESGSNQRELFRASA